MRFAAIATHRLTNPCPVCRAPNDALTSAHFDSTPRGPKPGDLAICAYCKTLLAFTDTMTLRVATEAEWQQLAPEAQQLARFYIGAPTGGGTH